MSKVVSKVTSGFQNLTGLGSYNKAANQATAYTGAGVENMKKYSEQAVGQLSPYNKAGTSALSMYQNMLGLGEQGSAGMNAYQQTPGYQFRMQSGLDALDKSAAASGSLLSGAQQKALTEYGQNFGTNEYQNSLNNVGSLMNQGYNAATSSGNYLMGTGSNISGAYSGLGNTLAQTYAAKGQAKTGMFGGAMSGGSTMGAAAIFSSDINLKQNIKYTGNKSKDGFNIIEFNYNDKSGLDTSKRYRGVIAQEVEMIRPEAVIEENGFKKVDYSQLDVKMEEI
jgi:hypothetical protein